MPDTRVHDVKDDAPASASKSATRRDEASENLIEGTDGNVVGRAITINRPRQELYDFWRDFSNLAQIMENIRGIEILDDKRSRWSVEGPGGKSVQWVSTVVRDVPGELIAWASDDDADVRNSGSIEFKDAPGGRGTVVTATIHYEQPAGIFGKIVAKIFQRDPAIQSRRDLRRFKQLMETGEISTSARTRAERAQKETVEQEGN